MNINTSIKYCPSCQLDKAIDDFYLSRNSKDGRQGWCKSCANGRRWERPRSLEEKIASNTHGRQYYHDNLEYRLKHIKKGKNRLREQQMLGKIRAVEYLGGSCQMCGFTGHPAVFHFHHRDPSQKSFNVGSRIAGKYSWDKVIKPELDKCDLLCANCHQILHCTWDI